MSDFQQDTYYEEGSDAGGMPQAHIDEFLGFTSVMCNYHCAIGQQNTALLYYQMLQQVAPGHPLTKQSKRTLYPPFWFRWLRRLAGKKQFQNAGPTEQRDLQ